MWKYLKHPNVLPLLGATINPPELVSVLMPGGNLTEYLMRNPRLGAPDRLRLVGVPLILMIPCLLRLPVAQYYEGPRLPPLSRGDSWRPQAGTLLFRILIDHIDALQGKHTRGHR